MVTTKENCLHRFCDICCLESLLSTYHVQLESLGQHNEELVCDYCVKFITYIGHLVLTTKLPKFPSTIMFIHFLLRYCFQLHWFSNFNYCRVHFIFRFFGHSDEKTKKSAVIFRQNAILLYSEKNRTADFLFMVLLTKKQKCNEPDI